jgi:hypothetical protein
MEEIMKVGGKWERLMDGADIYYQMSIYIIKIVF